MDDNLDEKIKINNLLLEFLINPQKKKENKIIKKKSYFSNFFKCLFCKK